MGNFHSLLHIIRWLKSISYPSYKDNLVTLASCQLTMCYLYGFWVFSFLFYSPVLAGLCLKDHIDRLLPGDIFSAMDKKISSKGQIFHCFN